MCMGYSKSAVMTVSGRFFDPLNPRAEDVDLGDVAHGLARIPRFNGQTTRLIPVDEHSMRVARIVRRVGGGPMTVLLGLLHDAGEAYVGDIVRPLKDERAKTVEAGVLDCILRRVAYDIDMRRADAEGDLPAVGTVMPPLESEHWAMVRLADDIALFYEAMLWQPGAEAWAPAVLGELVVDAWAFLPDIYPRPGEDWLTEVRVAIGQAGGAQ